MGPGKPNQIRFEKNNHVISHVRTEGDNFKILRLNFDCKLTMRAAIEDLVGEMIWRVKVIMRARRFRLVITMIHMYKATVVFCKLIFCNENANSAEGCFNLFGYS